uniref:Uncharacterized protein n=1 Tax=Anguilla anguilla TaxID=7936 RepID=A0A0E9PXM2_ANGAN
MQLSYLTSGFGSETAVATSSLTSPAVQEPKKEQYIVA